MVVPDGEASRLIAVRNLMMFEKGLVIHRLRVIEDNVYLYGSKRGQFDKIKTRNTAYIRNRT
jgi:hypothetical protein